MLTTFIVCAGIYLVWGLVSARARAKESDKEAKAWRAAYESIQRECNLLSAIEQASYAIYGVICAGGIVTPESPEFKAYVRASDRYWKDEIEGATEPSEEK